MALPARYKRCDMCGRRMVNLERHKDQHRRGELDEHGVRTDTAGRATTARRLATRGARQTAEIPQRQLRNDVSKVLAAVAAGGRFRITVGGRPVAEIVPITERRTYVPWAEVEGLINRTPLDRDFTSDLNETLDDTIEDA